MVYTIRPEGESNYSVVEAQQASGSHALPSEPARRPYFKFQEKPIEAQESPDSRFTSLFSAVASHIGISGLTASRQARLAERQTQDALYQGYQLKLAALQAKTQAMLRHAPRVSYSL